MQIFRTDFNHIFSRGCRRLAIALLFVLSALTASAQINAEQVMNIGRNVLSMEDYMLAIQYFNLAIKAKPYMAEPYYLRAIAKLNLEDYRGAEEDCSLALERNNYQTESYKLRGFARQSLGQDSLAVTDYDLGLRYNPQDKYFLFYKAVALTSMKRREAADSTFATLLRFYPMFEDGYTARAHLRVESGDTVGALSDLDKALSISRNLLNAYLLRAQINADSKKWSSALEDMGNAIKLKPQEADLYVNRAFLRYNEDDYFGAMADYNYALELEPYNPSALFNRALLRYEVKDLNRAADDFKTVLKLSPDNFHALYNLGLVDLERGNNKEALQSFNAIAKKYPRFYPVYYAMAEAYRAMGDMRTAMQNAYHGDDLVRKYVTNPEKNPLDRPKIAAGKTNRAGTASGAETAESEEEVMDRFNQLVTVGANEPELSYNEKIKGRVQDRDLQIEPEASYAMSFLYSAGTLNNVSNYFRELDDFNQRHYVADRIYLSPGVIVPAEEADYQKLFDRVAYYERLVKDKTARPADYMALGVLHTMLKNYQASIEALDKAIEGDSGFTMAYMARAYARYAETRREMATRRDGESEADFKLRQRGAMNDVNTVMADYDKALTINPRLVFSWFNKGNIYYDLRDYTSAMQCYSEAIKIDPSLGPAYFNRGICYLQTGNKRLAFADLRKAGELGVIPSYNLLKRMK